jgi:hypothetical protein
VLVAPAFLSRAETPGPGKEQIHVSNSELANRLSYFLWSSMPDAELREVAAGGKLSDPATLAAQTQRMLQDSKARRLATEFACQWLHIRDFDTLDEKSERHFPTFGALRGAMYEESIRFFTDMFQHDGSVLGILDSDHTYAHVLAELRAYRRLVPVGGFLCAFDTIMKDLWDLPLGERSWREDNPHRAVLDFVAEDPSFEIDHRRNRLSVGFAPDGFLRRVR